MPGVFSIMKHDRTPDTLRVALSGVWLLRIYPKDPPGFAHSASPLRGSASQNPAGLGRLSG